MVHRETLLYRKCTQLIVLLSDGGLRGVRSVVLAYISDRGLMRGIYKALRSPTFVQHPSEL